MVRETGDCPCGPAETLLREHIGEIDREIARLTALRAELSGMVAGLSAAVRAVPGPRSRHLVRGRSSGHRIERGGR